MRKWLMVGMLLAGAAYARQPEEINEAREREAHGAVESTGAGAGSLIDREREREQAELRRNLQQLSQEQQGVALTVDDAYELDGQIAGVNPEEKTIQIQRDTAPPAELKIADGARIERGGEAVSLSELQPGDEVRARFNLAGEQPFAVEVEAKKK